MLGHVPERSEAGECYSERGRVSCLDTPGELTTRDCTGFAVQVISRFVISHLLVSANAMAPDGVIISVGNPGWTMDDLSANDFSLALWEKTAWTRMSVFAAQMLRDSSVMDADTLEQNGRYHQRVFHLNPGLVASETFPYGQLPFLIGIARRIAIMTPAAVEPDDYADVPVFVSTPPGTAAPVKSKADVRLLCSPRKRSALAKADFWTRISRMSTRGSGPRMRCIGRRCGSSWRGQRAVRSR